MKKFAMVFPGQGSQAVGISGIRCDLPCMARKIPTITTKRDGWPQFR